MSKRKQKKTKNRSLTPQDSNIIQEQNEIENKLGLKVSISNKKNNSGKIIIEYKNLDQFDAVSKLLKRD